MEMTLPRPVSDLEEVPWTGGLLFPIRLGGLGEKPVPHLRSIASRAGRRGWIDGSYQLLPKIGWRTPTILKVLVNLGSVGEGQDRRNLWSPPWSLREAVPVLVPYLCKRHGISLSVSSISDLCELLGLRHRWVVWCHANPSSHCTPSSHHQRKIDDFTPRNLPVQLLHFLSC